MNIFKILDNEKYEELEVKTYEKVTSRKKPYFQEKNNKIQHYAICPACNNPIQIINLYVETHIDRKKDKQPLYAKHVIFDVDGLAKYDQISYESCPLANPSVISPSAKRPNGSLVSQEIMDLILEHYYLLYEFICNISGVAITESLFKTMIENFAKEEGYAYKGVTKFNLPYSFLYMTDNTNILYQPLKKSNKLAALIKDNIKQKCSNVKVENDFISRIDNTKTTRLEMYFSNHKISGNEEKTETMDLILKEIIDCKSSKDILLHTIEFKQKALFINTVNKHRRLKQVVYNGLKR